MKLSQRNPRDADHVDLSAPQCMLNEQITGRDATPRSRTRSRASEPLAPLRRRINDAVLAICGGALRTYLSSYGGLPDQPLIAMVPVSLRQDERGGNQIAMVLGEPGTHTDARRAHAYGEGPVEDGKVATAQMTPEERLNFTPSYSPPPSCRS